MKQLPRIVSALILAITAGCAAGNAASADEKEIEAFIDQLIDVSDPGIGYIAHFSGSEFLPYEGTESTGTLVIGTAQHSRSSALQKIVEKGPDALPVLIGHIDDNRKIKLKPVRGMMWMAFSNEYDFNRRTRNGIPEQVNRSNFGDSEASNAYAMTVGDLCFVGLGQIVNRSFSATRYQPTGGLIVNSPTRSARLKDTIRKDWGGMTKERLKQSLVDDFNSPDDSNRRIGAYLRLSLYYPEVVEQLVLDVLSKPTYDTEAVGDFERKLHETPNNEQRKQLFQEFVKQNGKASADGLQIELMQSLHEKTTPEILKTLFGMNQEAVDQWRVSTLALSERDLAQLIAAMTHDTSRKIGDAVQKIFEHHSSDDDLAPSCLSCLANRGYGPFLIEQLDKIDVASANVNDLHKRFIVAVNTSKDKGVRSKLLQIASTTKTDAYFRATLPAVDRSQDALILIQARNILAGMPAHTTCGQELLQMIGERFPDEAKSIYLSFLANGSPNRADTICNVLWNNDALALEILPPLLDNKQKISSYDRGWRVCDCAAQAIYHHIEKIRFDLDWPLDKRDDAIRQFKDYCKQHAK